MSHSLKWQQKCRTHNETHSRLYVIWGNMKQRCYNPNNDNYPNYGKKGITICDDWKNSFEKFRDWAKSNGYQDCLTIDRIDGTKGYYPENCRWVSTKIQNNNLSRNRKVTFKGETLTVSGWSEKLGIPHQTITDRLNRGYPLDVVFQKESLRWSSKVEHKHVGTKKIIVTFNGKTQSLYDFAKELGIEPKIVASRYYRGCPIEKVLYVGFLNDKKK